MDLVTLEECAVRMSLSAIEILINEYETHPGREVQVDERVKNIRLADNLTKSSFERSTPIRGEDASFLEDQLKDVLGKYVLPVLHILTKMQLEFYVTIGRVFAR